MQWYSDEPQPWPETPGVVVLESEPGEARDAVVERWLSRNGAGVGPTWRLECGHRARGPWAGLEALVEDIVATLRDRAPDLLARHGHELCLVVPALRSRVDFPRSLTDTVEGEEKTRNYAADRAYRSLHGLIELLGEWHALVSPGPVTIACDGYDGANGLVRRFFAELVRRRGTQLGLRLLLVFGPGCGENMLGGLDPSAVTAAVRLALPRGGEPPRSPQAMARLAAELEQQLADEPDVREAQLPPLIEAWRCSDAPERAVRWELDAMWRYNHAGLYEASLVYASDVEAALDQVHAEDPGLYYTAVNILYFCYVPIGRGDAARAILEQAVTRIDKPEEVAQVCYLLAMLHARFLEANDQVAAESYLDRALGVLPEAEIPDHQRHFLTVFMMNGLALVRLRERRVQAALDLCRAGVDRLKEHLDPDHHRLHRSVLLFNIAQVHAQIGPYEDAIAYFSQAMEMDPNYSEYYNDRGAVHFKLDRLAEAERDYLRAIELSPPYAEVWTNLGQCYRAMERMDDADRAYSRALDLDPGCILARVGRADARSALDQGELALDDYDRALELGPDQPLVLGSRAILHYEAGRLTEALADLDAAIELGPEVAELHQNRAVALRELGRLDEAARDLESYLELCPEAEDRDEVEASLASLVGEGTLAGVGNRGHAR
jgi:tetratricopeptide (TPR) repeat protein